MADDTFSIPPKRTQIAVDVTQNEEYIRVDL